MRIIETRSAKLWLCTLNIVRKTGVGSQVLLAQSDLVSCNIENNYVMSVLNSDCMFEASYTGPGSSSLITLCQIKYIQLVRLFALFVQLVRRCD